MAASRRIQITGAFLALSAIAITFLLVWKPGQGAIPVPWMRKGARLGAPCGIGD